MCLAVSCRIALDARLIIDAKIFSLEGFVRTPHLNVSKPLQLQGLFNSSIKPKAPKTPSNTWHHRPHPPTILSRLPRPKQAQLFQPKAKPGISTLYPY